jgi:tetratricopeptide (TPR) repeat protein
LTDEYLTKDTDELVQRGVALLAAAQHDEALAEVNRALTIDPRHAPGWNIRGKTLLCMKRYEDALQSFDRALSIQPEFPEATANRLALFREAHGNQNLANALCARGAVMAQGMRYEDAIVHFDEALLVKPDFTDALCNRAAALYELGDLTEALRFFEIALSLDPSHALSWNNRGHALAAMRRFTEALESYEKALALQPDLYDAREAQAALLNAARQGGAESN